MKKKLRKPRTMAVVRSWLPREEVFKYYSLFSDGKILPSNRIEAEQYATAYGEKVQTIYGEPEESTWAKIHPSTTGK